MLHLHGAMQLARQRHPGFIQRLQEAVLDHGIPAAALGGVEGGIRGFASIALPAPRVEIGRAHV